MVRSGITTGPRMTELLARRDLAQPQRAGAVVVDLLDGGDHPLDAEPLMDEVVTGPAQGVGQGVVAEQTDDRGGQGRERRAAARAGR